MNDIIGVLDGVVIFFVSLSWSTFISLLIYYFFFFLKRRRHRKKMLTMIQYGNAHAPNLIKDISVSRHSDDHPSARREGLYKGALYQRHDGNMVFTFLPCPLLVSGVFAFSYQSPEDVGLFAPFLSTSAFYTLVTPLILFALTIAGVETCLSAADKKTIDPDLFTPDGEWQQEWREDDPFERDPW